jgi:hypothetical protein
MTAPMLDALLAWPGLAGLSLEDDAPLQHERGIWGKAHQVTSDFRWLARSQGLQAQIGEFTIGPVDTPSSAWFWRGARGRHLAMRTYPTPARDQAQRHNAVEQQLSLADPREGLPAAAACALLMGMLDGHRHKDWWSERRDPRWGNDPGFFLPLDVLDVIKPSANSIAEMLAEGLDGLRAGLPLPRLAEALRGWVEERQGVVLDGLREPLSLQATAALLLAVPPAAPGEGLSVAGWVFSSRTQLETLAPLWSLVLCGEPPLGATPVGDAPAEWTRALERALAGDPDHWRALVQPKVSEPSHSASGPPILTAEAEDADLRLKPIEHALKLLEDKEEGHFDQALRRALNARGSMEHWDSRVIEALRQGLSVLVDEGEEQVHLAYWLTQWLGGPALQSEQTWCEAMAALLNPKFKTAQAEQVPKLLRSAPVSASPTIRDISTLAAYAWQGYNPMWGEAEELRKPTAGPPWQLQEELHQEEFLQALAHWVRHLHPDDVHDDVVCRDILRSALEAVSLSEVAVEILGPREPDAGASSSWEPYAFLTRLSPEAWRRRKERRLGQRAQQTHAASLSEAGASVDATLPAAAPRRALTPVPGEGFGLLAERTRRRRGAELLGAASQRLNTALRQQRQPAPEPKRLQDFAEGVQPSTKEPLELLLELVEHLPDNEAELHDLLTQHLSEHGVTPALKTRLRHLLRTLERAVKVFS